MFITKKLTNVFAGVVVALVAFSMMASTASAAFSAAQVAAMTAAGFNATQIAAMEAIFGGSSTTPEATSCATYGLPGVAGVQQAVNALGYMPALTVDGVAGPATKAGVMYAQAKVGASVDGAWGPATQAAYVAYVAANCTPVVVEEGEEESEEDSNDLQGGAGSITVDDLPDYSSEEVGEGEDEVEVLAFEVEADDESDVAITSVKLEFVQGTAADSEDLPDYAESVSVWLNGDMVGEADAEDFSENSDVWTKSMSLDDVVVEAGETIELVVAVTAQNSLDSGDINSDAWTVVVLNVRFIDADGVVTTEDTDADALEQSFDFAAFADSSDLAVKVSLGDDTINDTRVIDIDATAETDGVEILSFEIEAEGDSELFIKDLSVNFDSAGFDLEDGVTTVYLVVDGEEIASEAITKNSATPGTDETIEFDEIDFTIDAGDTVEFVVEVDLESILDGLVAGDTISANVAAAIADLMDAEDGSGEDVDATTDISGGASGEKHSLYDVGFSFELVDTGASVQAAADATVNDIATFTHEFTLTAFGGDVSIDRSCEEGGVDAADQGVEWIVSNAGSNTPTCTLTSTASDNADDTGAAWLIEEGETETFTLTVATTTITADHFADVYLESINWDDDVTDTTPDLYFTAGLGEEKTKSDTVLVNFNA
ncbi:MAG: peptidoglycan-binding protein [Candidatus Pacebacteria bacterium]|nr:peptidoglycan-binding protein [Candidatus Paceibacterota bacterium]